MLLPEAIAVVCAPSQHPRYPLDQFRLIVQYSWGVFRLTGPGVQTIVTCDHKTNEFHSHSLSGVYEDCFRGSSDGHVSEVSNIELVVVDLRNYTCR